MLSLTRGLGEWWEVTLTSSLLQTLKNWVESGLMRLADVAMEFEAQKSVFLKSM